MLSRATHVQWWWEPCCTELLLHASPFVPKLVHRLSRLCGDVLQLPGKSKEDYACTLQCPVPALKQAVHPRCNLEHANRGRTRSSSRDVRR